MWWIETVRKEVRVPRRARCVVRRFILEGGGGAAIVSAA